MLGGSQIRKEMNRDILTRRVFDPATKVYEVSDVISGVRILIIKLIIKLIAQIETNLRDESIKHN